MELEPKVIEVSQLAADELLRRRTNTLIGQVLLHNAVSVEYVEQVEGERTTDLASAIDKARSGDSEALELVRANVGTDYFERAYKYGFISEVELVANAQGQLMQYGQSLHDIHLNSLKFTTNTKLRERAKIEALNSLRDQQLCEDGLLRDYARVVFSHIHDDMSTEEADRVGFFTRTKSLSIQLLTEKPDGNFVMQTAFVAGRENSVSRSFDKQAVMELAGKFGISYEQASSEDILARPILIHKSLLPEGILSVVEEYDQAANTVTGNLKFFGRNTEKHTTTTDYLQKKLENEKQKQRMSAEIEAVVQKLLASGKLTALQATERLSELNDAMIKAQIIADETIDAGVLGVEAAYFVEHARHFVRQGLLEHPDLVQLQLSINRVGVSSSCPSGGSKPANIDGLQGEFGQEIELSDSVPEDCDFISKECPKCGEKNVKTSCRKGVYYGACGCTSK